MEIKESPNYYAILTANVRYSKNINANEKLLYAEITSLSNATGICWASNAYFANLFDCTPQAISKWIKNLEKNSFIQCEYTYKKGTKEIEKRMIKCINIDLGGINSGLIGINNGIKGINGGLGGYQHTIKENTKNINIKKEKQYNIILPECIDEKLWKEWKAYRKEIKKPLSESTEKKQINLLIDLHKKGNDISDIINQSILNGWQGLFEVKTSKSKFDDDYTLEDLKKFGYKG